MKRIWWFGESRTLLEFVILEINIDNLVKDIYLINTMWWVGKDWHYNYLRRTKIQENNFFNWSVLAWGTFENKTVNNTSSCIKLKCFFTFDDFCSRRYKSTIGSTFLWSQRTCLVHLALNTFFELLASSRTSLK